MRGPTSCLARRHRLNPHPRAWVANRPSSERKYRHWGRSVQSIGVNLPRAISPEGIGHMALTADGKFVFGFSDAVSLYPIDGQGAPRPVSGLHPDDSIDSVSPDGHSVLVDSVSDDPYLNIYRVDLTDGRRQLYKRLGPTDAAGVLMWPQAHFTPDGKYYAYAYSRTLSELYVVDGLR